jgi:hypothetical protein
VTGLADRAEALFASLHDPSEAMSPGQVETAVQDALRLCGGVEGCACYVAKEYGEHPDTAAVRMLWALAAVAAAETAGVR